MTVAFIAMLLFFEEYVETVKTGLKTCERVLKTVKTGHSFD